jgi:hypothetical protein
MATDKQVETSTDIEVSLQATDAMVFAAHEALFSLSPAVQRAGGIAFDTVRRAVEAALRAEQPATQAPVPTNASLREGAANALADSPAFSNLPRHERVSCYDEVAKWVGDLLTQHAHAAPAAGPVQVTDDDVEVFCDNLPLKGRDRMPDDHNVKHALAAVFAKRSPEPAQPVAWTLDVADRLYREFVNHSPVSMDLGVLYDAGLRVFGPSAVQAPSEQAQVVDEHAHCDCNGNTWEDYRERLKATEGKLEHVQQELAETDRAARENFAQLEAANKRAESLEIELLAVAEAMAELEAEVERSNAVCEAALRDGRQAEDFHRAAVSERDHWKRHGQVADERIAELEEKFTDDEGSDWTEYKRRLEYANKRAESAERERSAALARCDDLERELHNEKRAHDGYVQDSLARIKEAERERSDAVRDLGTAQERVKELEAERIELGHIGATQLKTELTAKIETLTSQFAVQNQVAADLEAQLAAEREAHERCKAERDERAAFAAAETEHANKWSVRALQAEAQLKAIAEVLSKRLLQWRAQSAVCADRERWAYRQCADELTIILADCAPPQHPAETSLPTNPDLEEHMERYSKQPRAEGEKVFALTGGEVRTLMACWPHRPDMGAGEPGFMRLLGVDIVPTTGNGYKANMPGGASCSGPLEGVIANVVEWMTGFRDHNDGLLSMLSIQHTVNVLSIRTGNVAPANTLAVMWPSECEAKKPAEVARPEALLDAFREAQKQPPPGFVYAGPLDHTRPNDRHAMHRTSALPPRDHDECGVTRCTAEAAKPEASVWQLPEALINDSLAPIRAQLGRHERALRELSRHQGDDRACYAEACLDGGEIVRDDDGVTVMRFAKGGGVL